MDAIYFYLDLRQLESARIRGRVLFHRFAGWILLRGKCTKSPESFVADCDSTTSRDFCSDRIGV